MDGNEELKHYFAERNRANDQTRWQGMKGYRDGPILMLAFILCLFLWIYSLYFSPVVVRSSLLVPWQVTLGLFWLAWTMVVAFRTRPNGDNAWRRAYRGEIFPRFKGVAGVVATVLAICLWCAAFSLPGASIAAVPVSWLGTTGTSISLQVARVSVWAPGNRNAGHKLMITADGPAYSGRFLWDRYDPALRSFDEERPGAIRCLRMDYRAWLGVAVIGAIHPCP
nr:hypothetical protein [Dyella sp. ASV24]